MPDDNDIRDVIADESSRGRKRPSHAQDRGRRERNIALYQALLEMDSESDVIGTLRQFGISEGSDDFAAVTAAWREYRRKRASHG
jgi:hypothetical protein